MNTDKQTWDEQAGEYLQRVSRALREVSHPRKKQVLDDLKAHLAQCFETMAPEARTRENMAALIAAMDPPEEYAELLAPATGAAPAPWYRRRPARIAAVTALILFAAWLLFVPKNQPFGITAREWLGCNYTASGFFSARAFDRLKPGMSYEEVRDLIGPPLLHRYVVGLKENVCDYTEGAVPGAGKFEAFEARFDRRTKTLLRTLRCGAFVEGGINRNNIRSVKQRMEQIGDLRLTRLDGSMRVLKESEPHTYAIRLLHAGQDSTLVDAVRSDLTKLEECLGPLKEKGVRVLHVAGNASPAAASVGGKAVAAPAEEVCRAIHLGDKPLDTFALIYRRGWLYALPCFSPISVSDEENREPWETWRDDQRWVLERVLK